MTTQPQNQWTDDALLEKYFEVEAFVDKETADFNKRMKPWKDGMETIRTEIKRRLVERKATQTKTSIGIAFTRSLLQIKVIDRVVFLKYCLANWKTFGADMINIKAYVDPVRKQIEENDTASPPPGLDIGSELSLTIRRA